MRKYYLGVDLGSTTSKAVITNEQDEIIGRGITNTRANYEVAAEIARQEATYNARFSLLKRKIMEEEKDSEIIYGKYIERIEDAFQYLQFKKRLDMLHVQLNETACQSFSGETQKRIGEYIDTIVKSIAPLLAREFLEGNLGARNQFFRDVVGEKYHDEVAKAEKEYFEPLMITFDKSITPIENELVRYNFKELVYQAMELLDSSPTLSDTLAEYLDHDTELDIQITNMTGTGYGRALLPFPENCIKSEILCHAFGAHAVFPDTRTVLDIGGQDTKAIQVDKYGLVTSFHMNDRCAAGCGRYLGYIADELNISLTELGPLALEARKEVNICSTCTVFAGAELRELLNIGEKREDILGGFHKAIVMRALSLVARSGGVRDELTFTGGVARNQAVLKYLSEMVRQNYGENITINIHSDSIFMGSFGAAMFARRNT